MPGSCNLSLCSILQGCPRTSLPLVPAAFILSKGLPASHSYPSGAWFPWERSLARNPLCLTEQRASPSPGLRTTRDQERERISPRNARPSERSAPPSFTSPPGSKRSGQFPSSKPGSLGCKWHFLGSQSHGMGEGSGFARSPIKACREKTRESSNAPVLGLLCSPSTVLFFCSFAGWKRRSSSLLWRLGPPLLSFLASPAPSRAEPQPLPLPNLCSGSSRCCGRRSRQKGARSRVSPPPPIPSRNCQTMMSAGVSPPLPPPPPFPVFPPPLSPPPPPLGCFCQLGGGGWGRMSE